MADAQISPKFLMHGQDPDVQISSHRKMRDKPDSRAAKAPITLGGVAGDGRRQVQGSWYMREESAPSTHNVVVMATPVHGALMRGGCEKRLANLPIGSDKRSEATHRPAMDCSMRALGFAILGYDPSSEWTQRPDTFRVSVVLRSIKQSA